MRNPIRSFVLSSLALASGVTVGLRTAAPAQDTERPTRPAKQAASLDPRLVQLQGAWELERVESPAARNPAFRHSGMMLLADGFLSIELHLGMVETVRERLSESYFQSGVHRVEVDAFGQLVLEGVVGAEVDEQGLLAFEPPGERRLYRYELDGERLVLTNLQRQARLYFKRTHHAPPRRNMFGRELPPDVPPRKED